MNDPQQPGPPRAPSVAVFSPKGMIRPSDDVRRSEPSMPLNATTRGPHDERSSSVPGALGHSFFQPAPAPLASPSTSSSLSFRGLVDAVAPASADELHRVLGPAVHVGPSGVGGRTAIGAPVTVLHRSGIATGLVLGGIPYALSILRSMHSEWSFVPARGTELVRLSVIERVAYRRALPALLAGLGVGLSIVLGGMLFGALLGAVSVSLLALVPLVFFFSVVTAWLLGNYVVLRGLRALGTELFATTVRIEHGFPAKTPLLEVAVQGSAQPVLTSVEPLLEKLGAVTPWRHVHMPGGGTPALLVQRDGEARR